MVDFKYIKPIRIKTNCGFEFYDFDDIIRFEADKNNTIVFSTSNIKPSVALMNLKSVCEIIKDKGFYRCHKSHVVNLKYIVAFHHLTRQIRLIDDTLIPVSINCINELKAASKSISEI